MSGENVCWHNKLGFCKFQNKCKSTHVNKVCEDQSCDIDNCDLRHPKTCNYYSKFGRCKFGEWCCYKHVKKPVKLMKSEYSDLMNRVNQLEKQMEEKDSVIDKLENKMDSFVLKNKIEHIEDMINKKDILIQNLQKKIDALKDIIDSKIERDDKPVQAEITFHNPSAEEMFCKNCCFELNEYNNLEKHMELNPRCKPIFCEKCKKEFRNRDKSNGQFDKHMESVHRVFKCYQCEFISESERGRNIHKKKNHVKN